MMFSLQNQRVVLKNFFLPLFFAFITFIFAVIVTETSEDQGRIDLLRILAIVSLGISVGFGIEFLQFQNPKQRLYARLGGFGFLVLQIFVSNLFFNARKFSYLYANLFLLSHLFVALSFWFSSKNRNQPLAERNQYFWNQNWRLFIGFLSSALVNGVLFVGLALAIMSLNLLFSINVPDRTILYLFYFLATCGGVYYLGAFLLEIHKDENESKILISLVRFVFPLLQILYFVILYIYLIKIIINWSLPRGYVAWLVSGLCVLICLSHLIIKPVQEKFIQYRVMQWVWRYSFRFIFPLLGLMFVSLSRRISDYGMTEKRYILMVLTVWMVYIVLTHLKPEKAKLLSIPLSLFILTLFTTIGPLNSYTFSLWSQRRQLLQQIERLHGQFENNVFNFTEKIEIKDQVRFVRKLMSICETYGIEKLFEMLNSKNPPIVLTSENYSCSYESGNNSLNRSHFGKLIESTKFEVLVQKNFLNYEESDGEVIVNQTQIFDFRTPLQENNWVEAFGFQIGNFNLTNYEGQKIGSQQLRFQKSAMDQFTWLPEKGSPRVIDLAPIMKKLAGVDKNYQLAHHPEDQLYQIENEFTQMKIKLTGLNFTRTNEDYQLQQLYFSAVGKMK